MPFEKRDTVIYYIDLLTFDYLSFDSQNLKKKIHIAKSYQYLRRIHFLEILSFFLHFSIIFGGLQR